MAAGYQELFVEQGSDFTITLTIDDVDGNPFDLTGYTAKSQVRKSYYSANATAEFIITLTNPLEGLITLNLSSANTANIYPGRYVYDLYVNDNLNVKTRVLEGIVNILPRVTVF